MLFPLQDRPRLSARRTYAVWLLGGVLVGVHVARLLDVARPGVAGSAATHWGLWEGAFWPARGGAPAALLTHLLIHGSALHLLGNLLFLAVFGPNVERRLGPVGLLLLFLACGAAGGLAFSLVQREGVLIGASGAVLGVTAFHALAFPRQRVLVLAWLLVVWLGELPARLFVAVLVGLDLVALLTTGYGGGRVAVSAHVGGLVLGALVGLWGRRPLRELGGERRDALHAGDDVGL